MFILINITALIISVVFHELAHGYSAFRLGDDTAKLAGRLTLNPFKHLDPMGSIVLPLILTITHSPVLFGWAKPVPVDFSRLKDRQRGMVIVALAGPLTNVTLVIISAMVLRWLDGALVQLFQQDVFSYYIGLKQASKLAFMTGSGYGGYFVAIDLFFQLALINTVLALFNLMPVPPLDGSRVIFPFLSPKNQSRFNVLERYGMPLIFLLLYLDVFDIILRPILYWVMGIILH
jgi:Zn-dependent protease